MALFQSLFTFSSSAYAQKTLALQIICILAASQLLLWIRRRLNRHSISYLPGPRQTDWLFGNLTELYFEEVGTCHLSWQKEYGHNLKTHGLFGEHYFMTSDPKAIQHIYVNSNTFVRQNNNRELIGMVVGPGIAVVTGDAHKRHRRIMQPGFGVSHIKALFANVMHHVAKLSTVVKREIDAGVGRRTATIDVHSYILKESLDVIGDAAFDYQVGALDDRQDDLTMILHESLHSLGSSTKLELFLQFGLEWLPVGLINLLSRIPTTRFYPLRAGGRRLSKLGEQIVKDKVDALMRGSEGGRDLLSLLMRANANEKQSGRLSDLEVRSEIASILFAGHGSTANTLSFGLWELAKDMELQRRLRQEINETSRRARERGETEIGYDEYDNMPLLVAFMKEVLRFHPVSFTGARQATDDSIIPLLHPIKLESGKIVSEIPISKGQQIWVNIPGYNRLPELFGEDADEFNADRWMRSGSEQMAEQGVGIYANLMTFALGPRACIGWRLNLLETQMTMIELISNFEFTLPSNGKEVRRTSATLMAPTIKGEQDFASALFLDVSIVED